MKKIVLSVILLSLINSLVKAQSGNKAMWSLGPEINFPFNTGTNNYSQTRLYYNDGIGGTLKAEFSIVQNFHITASAGYIHYMTNEHYLYLDQTANPPNYVFTGNKLPQPPPYIFLPIKAGLQYYYSKYLYLGAETGAAIKLNSASKTSFIYSGGVGGVIPLNAKSGFDIGLRYERGYEIMAYLYPMSQIGVRVAYKHSF